MEGKLNLDIAGSVSELETLLKKVLPKNIMWKLILSKGLEFDGYRDYTQDDDATNIDWKATVRGKKVLLKKYIEERDMKFMFLIDVSDNMIFGSTDKIKCEYTAEMVASIAHLILSTGDRVGFALYNDSVVKFRRPDVGNRQFDILVHELADARNYGGNSNLNKILEESLLETLDKSLSMVFVVSDFIRVDSNYKKNLEILGSMFETVAIIVKDPLDLTMPSIDREIVIEDPFTHEKLLINPKVSKNVYEQNARMQLEYVKKMLKDFNIDCVELLTNKPSSIGIAEFLKERLSGGRFTKKNVLQY